MKSQLINRRRFAVVFAVAAMMSAAGARAANFYWDPANTGATGSGGNGDWNTSDVNWYNGTSDNAWVNNTSSSVAIFGGTAGTVTVNGPVSVNSITFATTGYVLAGSSAITIGDTVAQSYITVPTGMSAEISAPITMAATSNPNISVTGGGDLTISGVLGGTTHYFIITGASSSSHTSVTLTNSNNFAGGILMRGGTLNLNNAGALGVRNIQFNSYDGGPNYIDNTSGSPITISSTATTDMRANFTFVGTNALTFSGGIVLNANRILTVAANTLTYNGAVTGSTFALTKAGNGTLVLNGNNTYSGATTITGGTLLLNGGTSSGNASAITANAGTLGGTGTIRGAVAINAATLAPAPGSGAGTLTILNTLTLADASILSFDLNGADTTVGSAVNDLVTGLTGLTLDGTLNVAETVVGSFLSAQANDVWTLISYAPGTLTDNGLILGTMPTLSSGLGFVLDTATDGQINLKVIALSVPEPATLGLLAIAGVGLMLGRRKR